MRKYYSIVLFFCILSINAFSQKFSKINGYVIDSLSNKPLVSVIISIDEGRKGVLTNQAGWFSLVIQDDQILYINYIGYKSKKILCSKLINEEQPVYIKLSEKPILSNEVVVESDMNRNKILSQTGYQQFTSHEIEHLPSIGGESDITKTLQMLPGVNTTSEGSARLNVRGGEQDQNLILIDGVQVYNPMHILGYFSSFNTDAINSVELLKGYILPEFSGKLSSVININLKEGNSNERKYSGGISLLSSQLFLEGPLFNIFSYMISARRTYLDPVLSLVGGMEFNYSFFDVYSKFRAQLSPNDRIFLSAYFGGDEYTDKAISSSASDRNTNWGNVVWHLKYNKIWNSSFFSDISLVYSNYYWKNSYKNPYLYEYSIRTVSDYNISSDFILRFGGDVRNYKFNVTSGLQENKNNLNYLINSLESNLFFSSKNKLNEDFETNIGFASSFFKEDKTNKSFYHIDPRMSISYLLNELTGLKISYTGMHQYIHSLSSTNFYAPNDVFYPSNLFLEPANSSQISCGITRIQKFYNLDYEFDLEFYYKDMKNIPQFKQDFNDADPFMLSDQLVFGKGWCYGLEFQVAKHEGRLSGWMNYSWNKVFRSFKGKNNNKPFVPKFYREHQFNLVINYNLTNSIRVGGNFVLSSGQPMTLPVSKYFIVGIPREEIVMNVGLIDYGEINGYRLPIYNRLDLSLVHFFEMWGGKWELFCSVYNVYNYKNPTFLSFSNSTGKFTKTTVGILPTAGVKFFY
jgi:hypothetical protein